MQSAQRVLLESYLRDAVTLMCKETIQYEQELAVSAVIAITVDNSDVTIPVHINEVYDTSGLRKQPPTDLQDNMIPAESFTELAGWYEEMKKKLSVENVSKRKRKRAYCEEKIQAIVGDEVLEIINETGLRRVKQEPATDIEEIPPRRERRPYVRKSLKTTTQCQVSGAFIEQ